MDPYTPVSCFIPLRWKLALLVTAVLLVLVGITVGTAVLLDWIIRVCR